MYIGPADFSRRDVQDLLAFHLAQAAVQTAGHAYAPHQLQGPDMLVFEARGRRHPDESGNGALLGIAGLKRLGDRHGEIKSVRTHPDHLRRGVSAALMAHLTGVARSRGYTRLSLETHPTPAYAAARALYERLGYTYCGPFGDYSAGDGSVFMTREI